MSCGEAGEAVVVAELLGGIVFAVFVGQNINYYSVFVRSLGLTAFARKYKNLANSGVFGDYVGETSLFAVVSALQNLKSL